MICNKCNMQIADDSKFCGFCGNSIVNAISNSESTVLKEIPTFVNETASANVTNIPIDEMITDSKTDNNLNTVNQETVVKNELKQKKPIKISKIFVAITILLIGIGTIGFLIANFLEKQ